MKLPIRLSLTASFCAAFLVMIALLEGAAYFMVRAAVHSLVDRELSTRLAALDDHLERHIESLGWPRLSESLKVHPGFEPQLLDIRRPNGEVLLHGSALGVIPALAYASSPAIATVEDARRALRVLTVRQKIRGFDYDLSLATDLLVPAAILRRMWLLMLLSLPLALTAASATGYWVSGRALRPVADITQAARSIHSANLSERLAVPDSGDEIQNLAETINAMLARIEDGFRQMRRFTADASHELRTPTAIIRASAEVALLRSPASPRSSEDALRRILRAAERNSVLLENMMHLARLDAGEELPPPRQLDLRTLLSDVCAQAAPLAESKGLRLILAQASSPLRVTGDEEQLRRLILIFLDNAIGYTAAGGSVMTTAGVEDQCPFVTVADTGIGIDAAHLPKIFERFYRVDKARTRGDRSGGLGLSIARAIADLHGAKIEVASEPGSGSSFRVTFRQASETDFRKSSGSANRHVTSRC